MATIKQINANRKNALLSKGPKSDLGKIKIIKKFFETWLNRQTISNW
jgi:hypothetical protein